MSYTKTTWVNDQAPAINATNLNKIETGIFNNDSNITDIIQNKLGLSISTWSASETYIEGNVVIYNNNLYRNITGNYTTTNPADDTTNWEYQPIIATWPLENNTTINPNILPLANSFEDTSIKTYNCDYINNCNPYSTTETNTHKKWVDGKDIYRKCYDARITTQNTNIDVNNFLSNVDKIVSLTGGTKGNNFAYGFYWKDSTDHYLAILTQNSTNLNIQIGTSYPAVPFNATVIVEYTKTTD